MKGNLAEIFANGLGDGTPAEHVAAGAIDADADWAFHARELLGEALGTHAAPPLCLFFRPGNEVIQIDDIAFSKDARALLRVEAEQVKQPVAPRFFLPFGPHSPYIGRPSCW